MRLGNAHNMASLRILAAEYYVIIDPMMRALSLTSLMHVLCLLCIGEEDTSFHIACTDAAGGRLLQPVAKGA